jgi:hypothetical protein
LNNLRGFPEPPFLQIEESFHLGGHIGMRQKQEYPLEFKLEAVRQAKRKREEENTILKKVISLFTRNPHQN